MTALKGDTVWPLPVDLATPEGLVAGDNPWGVFSSRSDPGIGEVSKVERVGK